MHRLLPVIVVCLGMLAGCSSSTTGQSPQAERIAVVAGESPWGAVAAAVGGDHVAVTSLLWAPGADPHEFQPTAASAAAVARARVSTSRPMEAQPGSRFRATACLPG